jgi:hypothetical protein
VLAGVGIAALAGGLAGAFLLHDNGGGSGGTAPRPSGPVKFVSATAYDPEGDGHEHDETAQNAIDSDPTTYWETEDYRSFTKSGVGVVVGARRAVSPRTLTVTTDTPGFTAVIKAGNTATGPFHTISSSRQVIGTTGFTLDGGGRYFLVWITDLGEDSKVHVNSVKAR